MNYYKLKKICQSLPLSKQAKETIKRFLYGGFPSFFKNWESYKNWEAAKVFRISNLSVWSLQFWQRKLFRSYKIELSQNSDQSKEFKQTERLAVIVHVFYPYIFNEIFELILKNNVIDFTLYITGTKDTLIEIKNTIPETPYNIIYFPVINRGRDIMPFLQILPKVFNDGHTIVLKLHTKGSNHLKRKDHWRHDLFQKLIGEGCINKAMMIFRQNYQIGMIGPAGNILPMSIYYGANGQKVRELSNILGLKDEQFMDLNFIAGSMFYARKEALLPVLNLKLSTTDFELEEGQTDATLAHAVERVFSAGLIAAQLRMADTDYCNEKSYLTISKYHYFTK